MLFIIENKFIYCALLLIFSGFLSAQTLSSKNYSWGKIRVNGFCLQSEKKRVTFKPCEEIPQQNWLYMNDGRLRAQDKNGELADKCLDLPTESGGKPTELQMWNCSDSPSMRWQFAMAKPLAENEALVFQLYSFLSPKLCLDASGPENNAMAKPCNLSSKTQFLQLFPDYAFAKAQIIAHNISLTTWMADLYKNAPDTDLRTVIIPGTHDSGTYENFSTISKTQSKNVFTQLEDGNRYLDLRIGKNNNIVHGIETGPSNSLLPVLSDIAEFARRYPQEIIFVDLHEIPTEPEAIKKLGDTVFNYLGNRLVPRKIKPDLTFASLWQQEKNIILLVRDSFKFMTAMEKDKASFIWSKSLGGASSQTFIASNNINWGEVWPDSTDFDVIHHKNSVGLLLRNPAKWHMSQLLRTPRISDAILTVLKIKGGPHGLVSEKTDEGIFNLQLDKWIYDWQNDLLVSVNFVESDFYEMTNIVPMAIFLNLSKLLK